MYLQPVEGAEKVRRIIGGRVYDTSTSRLIGAVERGERGAPGWYRSALYRKRTGEVYIHEEGGAASPVASDLGGGVYGPGEIIRPLRYEEAQEWARDHLKAEEAARLYRDARSERGPLGIKAAPETRERLRRAAARYGRRQGDILDDIIIRCIGEDGELAEFELAEFEPAEFYC